jgi:hypothetical protein
MKAAPQKEHQWLQKLVGEWEYETDMDNGPGKPRGKFTGTESVRSIGGLWIVCEASGQAPGVSDAARMIMTLGFDPQKQRFVGSWIGSMMTFMWLYDGALDSGGKVLALDCEGPSFTDQTRMAKYQDVIAFKDDDHRTLTARTQQGPNGEWIEFMTTHYRRRT